MYPFFDNIKSKPIITLGILVVSLVLVLTISSGISNIGSMLGFNTKENMAIKLEQTNSQLEKATELLEHNKTEDNIKKEIDVITVAKTEQDTIVINTIKDEEAKVLEQIKNTKEEIVDTKPSVTTIKDKPTIVYVKKKLNNKQKLAMSILRDRAKLLKGSKV